MTADPDETTQIDRRISPKPKGSRKRLALGLSAGLVAGALVAASVAFVVPMVRGTACDSPPRPLQVVTTPDLAGVLTTAVGELEANDPAGCSLRISITSADPAVTAADIAAERGDRPDVWIPDSSVWTRRATRPGSGVPADNPAIASSPVVLAVSGDLVAKRRTDRSLSVGQLVSAATPTGDLVRWVLREPEESATTVGALIELQQAVAGESDSAAWFGSVIRSSNRDEMSLAELATDSEAALPVTEQQLYAHNAVHPDRRLAAAYAPSGFRFDYPMVVLSAERARRDRAGDLLDLLRGDRGQELLAAAGFRAVNGAATAELADQLGAGAQKAKVARLADARAVNSAIRAYTSIVRPTQLLAVLDVSGSMAKQVPGAHGATRLDLAVQASVNGLAVYPDETVVGVWAFATKLDGNTDYKVVAPLRELGRGPDGTAGRQRVAEALGRIRPTEQRTGLNDTTLAAVREVRRRWDPRRVNSVVLITDGGDSDPDGISSKQLLRALRAENDPERPVTVFSIAYGPSGDFPALRDISAVTGGRAYAAPDPRQISRVLADAIGRRSCAPDC